MISSISLFSWVSSISSRIPVNPKIEFMGVLISWLIFARKTLFARFAASAESRAFIRSLRALARSEISLKIKTIPSICPDLTMAEIDTEAARVPPGICNVISWSLIGVCVFSANFHNSENASRWRPSARYEKRDVPRILSSFIFKIPDPALLTLTIVPSGRRRKSPSVMASTMVSPVVWGVRTNRPYFQMP